MEADFLLEHFRDSATSALRRFPHTVGQCVGLCAYISRDLKGRGVSNEVALGSLTCAGIRVFKYNKPIPARPKRLVDWDGHAWIEFADGVVGEPSLLRTARNKPNNSNIKRHLHELGFLNGWALLMSRDEQRNFGLKYVRKQILKEDRFDNLIGGLDFINNHVL